MARVVDDNAWPVPWSTQHDGTWYDRAHNAIWFHSTSDTLHVLQCNYAQRCVMTDSLYRPTVTYFQIPVRAVEVGNFRSCPVQSNECSDLNVISVEMMPLDD